MASWAEIGVVDFSAFPVGCAAADAAPTPEQLATAAAIGDVCRLHGFLKLRNFGIAAADVDAMFARARELFALPADHKSTQLAHHDKNSLSNRGYFPPFTEALNSARPFDLKEAFNVRRSEMAGYWRGAPPQFEPAASGFYEAAAELADRIMFACALALRLPPRFFVERHASKDLCTLRLLHYPPVPPDLAAPGGESSVDAHVRAGEHTDFGMITMVFVDSSGGLEAARGLQVRRPLAAAAASRLDGEWLDVAPEAGTVVVNTGGLLAQWTNDEWVATAHRVVVAPAAAAASRYSIAYFTDPDSEVLVECLPAFSGAERPVRYAPITSRDYLLAKLAEAQRKRAAAVAATGGAGAA